MNSTQPSDKQEEYQQLWEEFGVEKSEMLSGIKFEPVYRIGLTNYLREEWIFRMLPIASTDRVADIGCASGRQVFRAAKQAAFVIGTDIAQSFIDYAQKKQQAEHVTNVSFFACPIEALQIEMNAVDSVICSEVLEHVLGLDLALKELHRILKPGGKMLVTVPNYNADGTLWGRLLRLLGLRTFKPMTEFTKQSLLAHGDSHVREFSIATLRSTLEGAGFRPISWTTVSMIDGYDRGINFILRNKAVRSCIVWTEHMLSAMHLPFGRHIVLLCQKKDGIVSGSDASTQG